VGVTTPAWAGAAVVYVDDGNCNSLTPCYGSITEGIRHLSGPQDGTVYIFPGNYTESVDLNDMAADTGGIKGNISLIAVDESGEPQFGADSTTQGSFDEVHISGADPIRADPFEHAVTIEGIHFNANAGDGVHIETTTGPIVVRHSVANDAGNRGMKLEITTGDEPITVEHSVAVGANGANADGFEIKGGGLITVTDVEAHENARRGITIETDDAVMIRDVDTNDNGPGDDFADGVIISAGLDVEVADLSSQRNGDDGLDIETFGRITINAGTVLSDNEDAGADLTAGNRSFTIEDTVVEANEGIGIEAVRSGSLFSGGAAQPAGTESGFFVNNVLIVGNGDNGLDITTTEDVQINEATVSENELNGIKVTGASIVRIENSVVTGNVRNGILLDEVGPTTHVVKKNIICRNEHSGLDVNSPDASFNAEGNWWGDVSGPIHPLNPGGTGDEIFDTEADDTNRGVVDYTQWITTIEPNLLGGQPVVDLISTIAYVFTTDDRTVQFGTGPGSSVGTLPFLASTDNGTVSFNNGAGNSIGARLEGSQLQIGLRAEQVGEAHVTLTGPCVWMKEYTVNVGEGYAKGDLDCDRDFGFDDLVRSLRFVAGLPTLEIPDCALGEARVDMNCSDSAEGVDPLLLLLYLAEVDPGTLMPQGCAAVGT
jgi:hypothetical protein